jgi:hypothetical protein
MAIGVMQITEYDPQGRWRAVRTSKPAWPDVESAIRRMDGERFPTVWLYGDTEPPEDDVPDFELLGGKAGYVVTARPDQEEFYYRDDSASSEEVAVWISDQGFSCPGFMVCRDVERVIQATRCFYDTGRLLDGFPWSPDFG